MATNRIISYEHERIIRACYAEEKVNATKEKEISTSLALLQGPSTKLWKLEDSITGALIGYEIQDVNKNSIKRFIREGKSE